MPEMRFLLWLFPENIKRVVFVRNPITLICQSYLELQAIKCYFSTYQEPDLKKLDETDVRVHQVIERPF